MTTFEGCHPWEDLSDPYQPVLLDGRRLYLHDMDLLRIEHEPEERRYTLWLRWAQGWLPDEFADAPLARLDLRSARVIEWLEDPIELVPPAVSRQISHAAFHRPDLLQIHSLNLGLTFTVGHVAIAVLPDTEADIRPYPSPISDGHWIDPAGTRWSRRGDEQPPPPRLRRMILDESVRVVHLHLDEASDIPAAGRREYWSRIGPYLRGRAPQPAGDHAGYRAAEFRTPERLALIIVEETC